MSVIWNSPRQKSKKKQNDPRGSRLIARGGKWGSRLKHLTLERFRDAKGRRLLTKVSLDASGFTSGVCKQIHEWVRTLKERNVNAET
jgi:hypothetical protein